jgi:hypothetical protein
MAQWFRFAKTFEGIGLYRFNKLPYAVSDCRINV